VSGSIAHQIVADLRGSLPGSSKPASLLCLNYQRLHEELAAAANQCGSEAEPG
jgi:hypothetical protein